MLEILKCDAITSEMCLICFLIAVYLICWSCWNAFLNRMTFFPATWLWQFDHNSVLCINTKWFLFDSFYVFYRFFCHLDCFILCLMLLTPPCIVWHKLVSPKNLHLSLLSFTFLKQSWVRISHSANLKILQSVSVLMHLSIGALPLQQHIFTILKLPEINQIQHLWDFIKKKVLTVTHSQTSSSSMSSR